MTVTDYEQEVCVSTIISCTFKISSNRLISLAYFHNFVHVYSPDGCKQRPRNKPIKITESVLLQPSFIVSFRKSLMNLTLFGSF